MKSILLNKQVTFIGMVLIPMLLASIYIIFFASGQFESVSTLVVRQEEKPQAFPMASLMNPAATPGMADALVLEEFILSKDMYDHLETVLNIRSHYSSSEYDAISRMSATASDIDAHKYFMEKVYLEVDEISSIIIVKVKAFEPEFAQKILIEIINRSEIFVNEVGHSIARDKMRFVQRELEDAERNVKLETKKLLKVQDKYGVLTPEAESTTLGEIIGALEGEMAAESAQLMGLQAFLNPQAVEVKASKTKIAALKAQIEVERGKQTGDGGGNLNDLFFEFKESELSLKFAVATYETALEVMQTARLEAARKLKHLVKISSPNIPDKAQYPRKLYILVTLFVILLVIHGIGRLGYATVLDHRD